MPVSPALSTADFTPSLGRSPMQHLTVDATLDTLAGPGGGCLDPARVVLVSPTDAATFDHLATGETPERGAR